MRYWILKMMVMSKLINYSLLVLSGTFLLASCKTVNNISSFENTLYPEGRFFTVKPVDEAQQKRFEYFLLEASRYKMLGDINKSALYYKEAIDVDSTCATCYFEMAQLLYQNGDLKNCEEFAFKAVQMDPSNEWFLSFLSKIYHQNKKPEMALEAAKYLVDQYPNNIEYIYNLAQFQYNKEAYDDAIQSLNRIEKLMGKNEFLSMEKHNIYIQKKDYKSAEKELNQLIDAFPANWDYKVYLGDFFTQRNRLKDAIVQYKNVILNDQNNGKAYFSLANYYLMVGDSLEFRNNLKKGFSSSGLDFESKFQRIVPFLMNIDQEDNPLSEKDFDDIFAAIIKTHSEESKVYLLFANYLNHKDRVLDAISAYESSLLIDEKQEDVWQDFLFLCLNNLPNEAFLSKAKTAVELFPQNGVIQYLTGVAWSLNQQNAKAIEHLEAVTQLNIDNKQLKTQCYGFLGDLYYQENNRDKSFENYEKSLEIDDKQPGILNNYAYYLSLEEMELDKAERMISKVIEMEPGNATYLDTYAWVLFKRERYFEALFIIEQAISNTKEPSGVVLEHYGDILYKNGNIEKAVEMWKKAFDTKEDELSDVLELKIQKKEYIK